MRAKRCLATNRPSSAFTLVELVIVTVIVAMLASMAIPRIASGSTAATKSTVRGDIAVMSKAILIYAAEHNNEFPGPTGNDVMRQLTQYSDAAGRIASGRSGAYQFGPYLAAIPALPSGQNAGHNEIVIDAVNTPPRPRLVPAGWVYNPKTGEICPNDGAINIAVALDGVQAAALDSALDD